MEPSSRGSHGSKLSMQERLKLWKEKKQALVAEPRNPLSSKKFVEQRTSSKTSQSGNNSSRTSPMHDLNSQRNSCSRTSPIQKLSSSTQHLLLGENGT